MADSNLTFVTIATGKYLNYAHDLAMSIEAHLGQSHDADLIDFLVLTDTPDAVATWDVKHIRTSAIFTKQRKWPLITLERYEILLEHARSVHSANLVWIDSDMRLLSDFDFVKLCRESGFWFSSHPGFNWSFKDWRKLRTAARFHSVVSLARSFIRNGVGGFGDWEGRVTSSAFVEKKRRMTYVHGAVWGGRKEEFISACEVLAAQTRLDSNQGLVAKWHDESHLNRLFANSTNPILAPREMSSWPLGIGFHADSAIFISLDKKELDKARMES